MAGKLSVMQWFIEDIQHDVICKMVPRKWTRTGATNSISKDCLKWNPEWLHL